MRRRGALLIGILLLIMLSACGQNQEQEMQEGIETSESTFAEKENAETSEETEMKLYFDDKEILVKWEKCKAVKELQEEVQSGEITVHMSMYGDWEQVGSLGRSYTRSDKQMTAVSGDIVLS